MVENTIKWCAFKHWRTVQAVSAPHTRKMFRWQVVEDTQLPREVIATFPWETPDRNGEGDPEIEAHAKLAAQAPDLQAALAAAEASRARLVRGILRLRGHRDSYKRALKMSSANKASLQKRLRASIQRNGRDRDDYEAALAAAVERAEAAEQEADRLRDALRQGVKYVNWHLGDMESLHGIQLLRGWADSYELEVSADGDDS